MIDFLSIKESIKYTVYLASFVFGFLGLPPESFLIFGVLIVLDSITGVVRSAVLKGTKSVTSTKLTSGVVSKMLVFLVPIVIALAGRGAGFDLMHTAQGVLSILIVAEAYSVLSNVYAIRVKKDIPEFDAVTWVLRGVRKTVERFLLESGGRK